MRTFKKIIFFILLFFFISSLTKNLFDYEKKIQFYENTKSEYEKEKKKNLQLKTEALKNSDVNEIEKTIRNKLNLAKPGEIAIIIPSPTPTETVLIPTPLPNWLQWKELFLKSVK